MDQLVIFSKPQLLLCVRLLNFSQPRLRLSGVTNMKVNSANEYSIEVFLLNLNLSFSTFIHIYHEIVLSFTVLLISF